MFYFYKWETEGVGFVFMFLGLLIIPITFLVAYISGKLSDRVILLIAQFLTLIGLLAMIEYVPNFLPLPQYLTGFGILFVAC